VSDDFTARADLDRHLSADLSELAFIGRVLGVANDGGLALLERVRFLALVSEALDRFFQTRMAKLHADAVEDAAARRLMVLVRSHVDALLRRQDRIFHAVVVPRLADHGIRVSRWASLEEHERAILTEQFNRDLLPMLGAITLTRDDTLPLAPDTGLCLLVSVGRRAPITQSIAVIPDSMPRLIGLRGGAYVRLEDVIAAHREELGRELGWSAVRTFRVTRSHTHTRIDLATPADDVIDLRAHAIAEPVRLEVQPTMPGRMRDRLARNLGLARVDVYDLVPFLDTGLLRALASLDRADLRVAPRGGVVPGALHDATVSDAIRDADLLVHHPYESFDVSVLGMVRDAADDPSVVAVRQTLPVMGDDNPMVHALVDAARAGKQVDVVIAPEARLGDHDGLQWVQQLRRNGARVVNGPGRARVHAKLTAVVRRDDAGLHSQVHIGTGNYHSLSSRWCEDVSLFTANPAIAMAAHDVFDAIVDGCVPDLSSLAGAAITSPRVLRQRLLALIHEERVAPERSRQIILKLNHLTDPELIDALYAASNDGVQVDVIVRGTCALRPGVEGLSANIRVRSVIGPVLEHSRIFVFGAGRRARWYLGSADLLASVEDDRVEFVIPVLHDGACERLREIVSTALLDDARAWELRADGSWHRVSRRIGVDGQETLLAAARARAEEAAETS